MVTRNRDQIINKSHQKSRIVTTNDYVLKNQRTWISHHFSGTAKKHGGRGVCVRLWRKRNSDRQSANFDRLQDQPFLEKHCMCFLESILQDSQRGIVVSITTWIKLKGIAAMNPGVKEPRLSLSNCGFLFRLLFLNVMLCLQCLGRVGARRIACFSPKLFLGMFIVKRNLKNSCNFVWESGKQSINRLL